MTHSIVIAPARPVRRSFATATAAAVFSLVAGLAGAQTPPAQQQQRPAQQRPAQPAQQRPAQPAQPAQPPAAAPAPAPQAQPQQQMPQLIYSPWAKFCGKGQDANAKQVCFTGKDARTEAGVPVVAAALIEPEGEPKKIFRITLPSPLQLQYGTRVIVDQQQPLTGPFFTCFANGCMADYEGTPDLIGKLKKGQTLTIQAINLAGAAISFPLPLAEFAKANEGPPVDPKVFEEQQKKLQEELQKRAEEARKKLEQSGGQAPK
jgi:invasion protein IalB